MKLRNHEKVFELKPLGIKYICEFCNEGEMIVDTKEAVIVQLDGRISPMRTHICNKCGKTMQLPKSYPYIEWVTEEEYKEYKRTMLDALRANAEQILGPKIFKEDNNDSTEVHMDN